MIKRNIFYDKHAKTKKRLFILSLMLAFVSIGAGLGILKLSNVKTVHKGLDTIVADRMLPLQHLKRISDMYAIQVVDAANKALHGNMSWSAARSSVAETTREIPRLWTEYLKTHIVDEEKNLIRELTEVFPEADRSLKKLMAILHNEDRKALNEFVQGELYRHIDPVTDKIGALFQTQIKIAKEVHGNEMLRYQFSLTLGMASIVLSIVLCVIIVLQRSRWRALYESL